MAFLPIAAAAVVVPILGILGFAATRPDTLRYRRAARIKSGPEGIWPLLVDFRKWASWSPWEKLDPDMKRSYEGAGSGAGAVYAWEGDRKAGAGRMEIREAIPHSRIVMQLDFFRPFKVRNTTEFTLRQEGDSTEVVWEMRGPNPFISKVMCLFIDFDKLVGKDFETGLANLKDQVESRTQAREQAQAQG